MNRIKIGLNGFGRIGRAIFRINDSHNHFDIIAVNDIDPDLDNMLYLLKYDTAYGRFNKKIEKTGNTSFSVEGKPISYSAEKEIDKVKWPEEIELIIDASGVKRNVEGLKKLVAGKAIKKGVITFSPDNVDETLILGANESVYDEAAHHVVSSSICDANAVAQILNVVDKAWGIQNCVFTTLHPWLSYQNLVDGTVSSISSPGHFWTDYALGRASSENLIPKDTTAAHAIVKALPHLAGKLEAISFRIPTGIVTCSDITVITEKPVTAEGVNARFKEVTQDNAYLGYNDQSLVSVDFKQTEYSGIFDARWTRVLNGNILKLVVWYDNEWGYSARALDVAKLLLRGQNG